MKKTSHYLLILSIALTTFFAACKKSDSNNNSSDSATVTELTDHSADQARVSGEVDAIANDANTVLDDHTSINGRVSNTIGSLCGATITVDSVNTPKTVTITYNGADCSGTRTRTGVVTIALTTGTHWKDAGAVLTINITNLKITRLLDNKSITINGTKTITNVSGGRLRDLATHGPITHDIASPGLTILFDNGTTRTWQVAKERVFSYNNGVVITTTGLHTDGTTTGISEWGTNRNGNAFVTAITQPMVIRQDCDYRLTSGQVTHTRLAASVVATFGLDSTGVATSCPGTGHYYFKIVWTNSNGIVRTYILPY